MKIENVEKALSIFEEVSIKQSEAIETGDYKTGNKFYAKIVLAANFLKDENAINKLENFLLHESIGVRLWSASYLLSYNEKDAIKVLESIEKTSGIHSLTAETTLSEWRKGNLNL
ncbi:MULTISPECIES: DUF2019 domain-containing protein [Flavobacterium]|uniref:DUF2019 domain-containing protein n=1 Tax=Flavobacterium TaxID=237 RepID=UPI00091FF4B9|nr:MULTISPECIES: DUF2019 domain-containing protein [Flavobacterium]OXA71209.1 DUF2019 domain-containing protein [Flavobacterium aquidurense]SHG68327.1 protein of unknown function [Flavobacterium frigidimaris]